MVVHVQEWLIGYICVAWQKLKTKCRRGGVMTIRTQSRTPKYEMTKSDIARSIAREREVIAVEAVTRALIEKGIEPQLTLKEFARRFRGGDLVSVQTDVKRGHLVVVESTRKYENRKVDMVAYFGVGILNCLKHER
ncbi:hypothetical protein D6J84_14270 [Salmonella enterica subsp. enterica]|nr:hypothetical protein [Salmonella enterica subsp. enterica serovar Javiana]